MAHLHTARSNFSLVWMYIVQIFTESHVVASGNYLQKKRYEISLVRLSIIDALRYYVVLSVATPSHLRLSTPHMPTSVVLKTDCVALYSYINSL